MKKIFVVMGLLLIATMLFVGCGDVDNSSPSTTNNLLPNQNYDKTGTLQGKIMDAVTGAPIGNDANGELSIWLIQGTQNRGADKIDRDTNSPLCGEYAFAGIPVDGNDNDEIYFKIVVAKGGYQRFEAEVYMYAAGWYNANDDVTYNSIINMIGNIYLFPLGTSAGDVSVYVYDPQGRPIPNATVMLRQEVNSNSESAYTSDRLAATNGLQSSLSGTTSAAGLATFASANLTLGGSYSVVVEPITFEGQQLARNTAASFIVGTVSTSRNVTMAVTNNVLFATSASNQVPGTITSTGVLSVTFNQPITLSTLFVTATLSTGTGTVTSPVTAVMSNSNQTITLTPTFTTTPAAAGQTLTYSWAGAITLNNSQTGALCGGGACDLFDTGANGITNITTGSKVSGVVQLIAN